MFEMARDQSVRDEEQRTVRLGQCLCLICKTMCENISHVCAESHKWCVDDCNLSYTVRSALLWSESNLDQNHHDQETSCGLQKNSLVNFGEDKRLWNEKNLSLILDIAGVFNIFAMWVRCSEAETTLKTVTMIRENIWRALFWKVCLYRWNAVIFVPYCNCEFCKRQY